MRTHKRKTTKSPAVVLRWHRQVLHYGWDGDTHRTAIIAVAAALIDHADTTGHNAYPSIDTIRRLAGINRNTTCDALRELTTAGMLTRHGKKFGATNYRLRLLAVSEEILQDDTPSTAESISHSIPSDTQPPTSEVNTEEVEEKFPMEHGVNAVSIENPILDSDEADHIITTFVTAFDPKWATRPRPKTLAITKLEPSNPRLREALLAKAVAGWPISHLVERIHDTLPTDERSIRNLTSLVASKLRQLPTQPDHAARIVIDAQNLSTKVTVPTKCDADTDAFRQAMAEILDTVTDLIIEIGTLAHPDDDERDRHETRTWREWRHLGSEYELNIDEFELDPHEYITTENLETFGAQVEKFYRHFLAELNRRRNTHRRATQRQAQRSNTK